MERNVNIDLLKIASCVGVVGFHSIPRGISNFNMILYLCCSFSVPVFYMAFGYQMAGRGRISISYAWNKILNILCLISIWNLVICLIGEYLFPIGQTFTWGVFSLYIWLPYTAGFNVAVMVFMVTHSAILPFDFYFENK